MNLREVVRSTVGDALAGGGEAVVPEMVKLIMTTHPDVFGAEAERLAFNALTREVKDYLRSLTDDEDGGGQMSLPGLDLPSAIALPTEGGYVYKATRFCTFDELQQGRQVRLQNVERATAKLDTYDEGLARLAPVMEGTSLVVEEAWLKIETVQA